MQKKTESQSKDKLAAKPLVCPYCNANASRIRLAVRPALMKCNECERQFLREDK